MPTWSTGNRTCSPASSGAPAIVPASRPAAAAASRKTTARKPEPVAICRLKRVAADHKDDIRGRLPKPGKPNGTARGLHRRRPGVADGGARSRAARLPRHRVRQRGQGRRLHAHPGAALPPARSGDRRGGRLHPRPRRRLPRRPAHRFAQGPAGRRLRRRVRRLRRAARARPRPARPRRGSQAHPHRHRLAGVGVVRPHRHDRPARDRARRRQHRDGLLPLGAPPRRRGRQGDRALRLRGDEGLAVGKGRRPARGHPDPQLPRAGRLRTRGRPAHRHAFPEGARRTRCAGPAHAGVDRRAGAALRLRRGADRGRPGKRVSVDRARSRPRLRPLGPAGAGQGHAAVDDPQRVLRRRRRVRPEEHHLGRRPRPRRGDLDRQAAQAARTSASGPIRCCA